MARIGSQGPTGLFPEAKQLSTYALLPITAAYRSGIEMAKIVDRGVWSASIHDQISPIRPELLAPELRGLKDFELKILSPRPHVNAPGDLAVASLSQEGAGSPRLSPPAEGKVWETELFGIHRIEPIAPRSLKPRARRRPHRADTCAINAPASTPVTATGVAADFSAKPKRELAHDEVPMSSSSRSSSRSSRSAAAGANAASKGGTQATVTTPRGCPEDVAWRKVVSAAQKDKVEEPQLQTGGANSAPVAASVATSSGALQPRRGPRAEVSPRMPAQLAIVSAPLPPRRATAPGDLEPVPPEDAVPLPPRRAAIHYVGSVYTEPYVEPAVAQNRMEVAVARAVGAPGNSLPADAARASDRKLSPRRPRHAAGISSQNARALPTQPTQLTKGKASPRPPVVIASLSPLSSPSSLRRSAAAAAAAAEEAATAMAAELAKLAAAAAAAVTAPSAIEEGMPARLPILPPPSLRQWARQRVIKDENLPACTFNPGEIIMFGGSAQERAALGRMLVRMGEAHSFSRHAPRARALGSRGALLSSRSNRSSRGSRSRKASRQGSPDGLSGSHSAREVLPNMAPELYDGIRAPRPPVHSDAAIAAGPWPPRPPPHPAPPISGGDTKVYRRPPKFGIQTANLQPDQWHIELAASPAAAAMLPPPPERFANAGRVSGARAGRHMLPSVDQASPALTSMQGALRARQVKDVVEGYESAGGGEDQDAIAGWPSAWLVQPTVA